MPSYLYCPALHHHLPLHQSYSRMLHYIAGLEGPASPLVGRWPMGKSSKHAPNTLSTKVSGAPSIGTVATLALGS
jgi:hypothetical protein